MIPELGHFALLLALCFAGMQSLFPLIFYRAFKSKQATKEFCMMAAIGQWIFLSMAMLCLVFSFILNDMTVLYVREHSHILLPFLYRIGATWGGHEGSLLLWCFILSSWALAFSIFSYHSVALQQGRYHGGLVHMLMVLGAISLGFIFFLTATSNPFVRDFPTGPINGNDLVPLLQDPGLLFHPPMLYLGYVGCTIGFAFAVAALVEGNFSSQWAALLKPWVVLPWCFLGCGIVLGSWWAYRELGWGGWWFWDPVENASLMPWLIGTALIHSLIVTEKQGVFKGWTLLLAIMMFGLSLMGTFLVRSGVLVSVHAFANDPLRGTFLLIYLGVIIGSALLLYAYRIKLFYQPSHFSFCSREILLLLNSIIFLTLMATVLLGTIYPIILDALSNQKISVGEPYFNAIFMPMILILVCLMALVAYLNWQPQPLIKILRKIYLPCTCSLFIGWFGPQLCGFPFNIYVLVSVTISIWLMIATVQSIWQAWHHQARLHLRQYAMAIAHIGLAVLVLGATFNKSYSAERQVKIKPSETVTLAGYQFYFAKVKKNLEANYTSTMIEFIVSHKHFSTHLVADQRIYLSHQQTFSKPGLTYNAWRDLYLALGTAFPDGSWSVRLYYKPCVRWIWFGGFLIILGGFLSWIASQSITHYRRPTA